MSPPLTHHLASLIGLQGNLPFHRFMEQALFHPEYGFYASEHSRTGADGDFLTPVSPGPVLGQLLARQAEDLHVALGRPKKIRLIEQGADAGWLARDLLATIRRTHPELAPAWELHILEPLPRLVRKQKETLREDVSRIQWHSSWETIPHDPIPCCFYSCELVDSFPVRLFRFQDGRWHERGVGWDHSRFSWRDLPADAEAVTEIRRWQMPDWEGTTRELRPAVRSWVQSWAWKIRQGMVLTLDYGFPARELFAAERSAGTLVALRSHQPSNDPLADPGRQDLTAHVNFTELEEEAARAGWRNYGLTDFARGFTALAAPLFGQEEGLPDTWIRNFRHLTHPSFFGQTHKILVQGKGLPESFHPAVLGQIAIKPKALS